jgi:hypothetical protein
VGLSIYDDGGTLVADLASRMIPIGGNSEKTVGFVWHPAGAGSGSYTAIATVGVESQTYGPAQQSFQIGSKIYLPVVLKDYP